MASILVPFAYIIVVFGALFIFSHYYRKHTSAQTFEPYFSSHPERNTYVTLLQKTDPPTPDALLKAALVRRAVADVYRVIRVREDKPALQNLLQKGSVGDDLWNSLLAAERELEGEVMEVVTEANSFLEGWGQMIFGTANEIIANDKIRATFEQISNNKVDLELKYGVKAHALPTLPPPASTAPSSNSPKASAASISATSPKSTNSLQPPLPSNSAESVASSDGEGSQKFVSKNARKNKKRK
ncbi:uncharacterized protein BT62DRAFT_1070337 [Guyanagaster necrorhizus]|uniref:Translocation protein sec66 n=1 Tax=Guyanagaster necrorhizus TaxID=856835 RepID=A0A9P8AYU4_9AGAR|nr:uncharacterized protein BT62DRAFT_1070337 [Guyanagaster necrorhizus MCA 3950]KAG7452586.1 hypothetical protein BT62DRAFT_1070337 [Guyanagaster necrorhizus MCA 3950]